jgi:hypothetical protein
VLCKPRDERVNEANLTLGRTIFSGAVASEDADEKSVENLQK